MGSLIAEVDDLHLRAQVLRLATAVAHADKHLSEGETAMIQAINGIWQTSTVKVGAIKAKINLPALA